jgi:hypothetical protein
MLQVRVFAFYNSVNPDFFIILCNYFEKGYVTSIRFNFVPYKAL